MAAINAVTYPICRDCHLLPPLNHNLHLVEVHHHVAGQHFATVVGVLLTRAALVSHLRPNNLHHHPGRMKRTGRIFLGTFAFATGTGTGAGITSAGVAISAITGVLSFVTFAFFATNTFTFFVTGMGAPMTAPEIFATTTGTGATAAGASATAPGVDAEKKAFATSAGAATAAAGKLTSAASAARTPLCVGWGVAHIVQYLPPLLDEAHAPHTQLEAEEEDAMMGWLRVLVVRVWL
jgi:hypothetical protein